MHHQLKSDQSLPHQSHLHTTSVYFMNPVCIGLPHFDQFEAGYNVISFLDITKQRKTTLEA